MAYSIKDEIASLCSHDVELLKVFYLFKSVIARRHDYHEVAAKRTKQS